ncbi:MAG: hypothetical protein E7349_00045 [Clostridiales bacterium]|nr:hypothetical protein [Clostridiales bacterium]
MKNDSLVVVVTGDVLHQAPQYSKNQKAVNNALCFFNDLYQVLKDKVAGIYLVPGNHDKYRSEDNKFLIPAYRSLNGTGVQSEGTYFNKSFYDSFWKYHLETYGEESGSGYIYLVKQIYEIFGAKMNFQNKTFINETFGVDVLEIHGKKYCFVLLNTAWSCIDGNDNRNIILGQFQIETIRSQFQKLFNKHSMRPDVTIVLGHHPIGSLCGKEEDKIFNEMVSFDGLDANVYLCGHTHDRTVNNWVNNRHSISTFVTGMGWPEDMAARHVGNHTYSTYVFNLNMNSIELYVRSTKDDGTFSPDFRIYTSKHIDCNKLVFPIKAEETQTYITLSGGNNSLAKSYYISGNFIESIKTYIKRIERFRAVISVMTESDKNDLYENIDLDGLDEFIDKDNEAEEIEEINYIDEILYNYLFANTPNDEHNTEILNKIFQRNKRLLFEMFLGFLQKVCQKMQQILVDADKNDIVRFHFRYLADRNTFQYLRLCTSFPQSIIPEEYEVSEIKYGELIEKAYESNCSLIYSINEDFVENKLKAKWKNFITIVPLFENNNYIRKYKENGRTKKIPYLTFGVTTNNEKFDELLYCLDYFSFKETLEDIIDQYLEIFRVDIAQFCDWVKKGVEQGEVKNEQSA